MSVTAYAKVYAVSLDNSIVSRSVVHDTLVGLKDVLSISGLPNDDNVNIPSLAFYVSVKFEADDKAITSSIQSALDSLTQNKQIDLLRVRINENLDNLKMAGIETDATKIALEDAIIKK